MGNTDSFLNDSGRKYKSTFDKKFITKYKNKPDKILLKRMENITQICDNLNLFSFSIREYSLEIFKKMLDKGLQKCIRISIIQAASVLYVTRNEQNDSRRTIKELAAASLLPKSE